MGVKPIKRYMERMNEEDVKRAILVVQQSLTAFARQALTEIQSAEGLILEQFQEGELLVNITEHVLVPQHMVLTKEVRGGAGRCRCGGAGGAGDASLHAPSTHPPPSASARRAGEDHPPSAL